MTRWLLAALVLLSQYAFATAHNTHVTTPLTTPTDSRLFCAFLKASIPDIVGLTELDALPTILFRNFIAIGDDRVTASPIGSLDLAPTIAAGGNAITGGALTINDPNYNFAYYSGTTTGASAGTGTLSFTGHNAKVGCSDIVESVPWAIADSATPSGTTPIVGSNQYFVDPGNGCSNNNDGLQIGELASGAHGPWCTLDKVTSFSIQNGFAAGSDIWIKAGTTWMTPFSITPLTGGVDAANPFTIGSYYVSSGVAYVNAPTNLTVSVRPRNFTYTQPRPVFAGTYHTSCRQNSDFWNAISRDPYNDPLKCSFNTGDPVYHNVSYGAAIPATWGQYMVSVAVPKSVKYITVQDIIIRDSAGGGLSIGITPGYTCLGSDAVCYDSNITMQRVFFDSIAQQGYAIAGFGRTVVRQNEFFAIALAANDGQVGWKAQPGGFSAATAGATSNCSPCNQLVEQNDVYDLGGGEGLEGFKASGMLIRGNEFYTNAFFDMGQDSDVVIEQNLSAQRGNGEQYDPSVGGARDTNASQSANGMVMMQEFPDCGGEACQSSGMPPAQVASGTGGVGLRLVHRNNLISNQRELPKGAADLKRCLRIYTIASPLTPRNVSEWFLGNTCLSPEGFTDGVNDATTSASVVIQNNLFGSANHTTGQTVVGCVLDTATVSGTITHTYNYNLWKVIPSVAGCRGSNDIVSTNLGLGSFDFGTVVFNPVGSRHIPTADDFITSLSGAGAAAGIAMTDSDNTNFIRTGTDWDWVLGQRYWIAACKTVQSQVTKAEWIKKLTTDFCGNARTTVTIGGRNAE